MTEKDMRLQIEDLKKQVELLKTDNEILQKDYYNQIIINEFIKLDEYIDNIDDLIKNLMRTIEELVEVDFIGVTLFDPGRTYFANFRDMSVHMIDDIRENFRSIIREHNIHGRELAEHLIPFRNDRDRPKDGVFSNITHKISRHSKLQGLISFYMFDRKNMNQKSKLIRLFMPHISTLLENSILIERQRVTEEVLRKKLSAFSTLYKLSRMQTNYKKIDTVYKKILKSMIDEFYGMGGSLLFIDSETDELYVKTYLGAAKKAARNFRMKIGSGLVGRIAKEGKPLVIIDKKFESRDLKMKNAHVYFWDFEKEYSDVRKDVISAISAPVKFKNEILGVVSITSDNHVYNDDDLQLLEIFASNIAYVARNSNLYKDLTKRVSELEIVTELMRQVNVDSNLRDIMKVVFSVLTEKFDFRVACIILDEHPELTVNYFSDYNISENMYEKIEKELLSDVKGMLPRKLYSYKVSRKIINQGNKRFTIKKNFDFVSVPIVIRKQVSGFISVIQSKKKGDSRNIRFLSTLASAFSVVFENNIVYDNLEKKVNTLSTIFNVTKDIAEKLDFSEVSESLVNVTRKTLKAKLVVLRLFDDEKNELEIERAEWDEGEENTIKPALLDSIELPFSREAFMKKKSLYIDRLHEKIRIKNLEWLIKYDLNALFCVPLIIRGKVTGVLNCYVSEKIVEPAEELEILTNLCSQAAIALENSRLFNNLEKTYFDTIAALAAAIDAKDHYTHGHSEKVMEYAVAVAEEISLAREDVTAIKFAGLLHDVGKIGIDDSILKKPGLLTPEERKEIELHPVYGTRIVEKVEFLRKISKLTYHHHERWDGKGYPEGLSGDEIPLGARILSVADTFDAMTSSRSYRSALPEEVAIEEIKRCSGSQFDPSVVKAFLNVVGRRIRIKKMKMLRREKLDSLRNRKKISEDSDESK